MAAQIWVNKTGIGKKSYLRIIHVWPTTNWAWFDLVTLTLKAGIIFSFPALVADHYVMALPDSSPDMVHDQMQALAQPLEIFCIIAAELLFLIGAVKVYFLHVKKAVWDFIFVVLALFCWSFVALFTTHAM